MPVGRCRPDVSGHAVAFLAQSRQMRYRLIALCLRNHVNNLLWPPCRPVMLIVQRLVKQKDLGCHVTRELFINLIVSFDDYRSLIGLP